MSRTFPQGFREPAPGDCRVVLVRHGQSIPYRSGEPFPLVDGHGDPPLSPRGLWQAEAVADRLASEPIEAIVVTTLTRTQQTAAPLAARLGLTPQVEPRLREVFFGEFEGGVFRERFAEGHPATVDYHATGDYGSLPGAESNADLQARVVTAIDDIAARHPDQMVAVFCHGGVIGAALAHGLGTDQRDLRAARNGSLNYLYVNAERWTVRTFNDASHVGPLTEDLDP